MERFHRARASADRRLIAPLSVLPAAPASRTLALDEETVAALVVRHRLLIRHSRHRGLALIDISGDPKLPVVTTADAHTAETDHINAAVAQHFGIRATVLRSLSHSASVDGIIERVHELEVQEESEGLTSVRWGDPSELTNVRDPRDRAAVALWLPAQDASDVIDGREWTRPGWLDGAEDWTRRALADACLGAVVEIRQLRNWPSSCVLRARTENAEFYFKALPCSGRVELAVTTWLAAEFPDAVPRIIATERERRWLLTEACPGHNLDEVRDIARWEIGAMRYARLQADCAAHVDELVALGCGARDLDALVPAIASLMDDADALRVGEPDGLTRAECDQLHESVPGLVRRCEELAAYGIPPTIEHGDLWPGNIFVTATTAAIIDWEDVAIGHPFFSIAPLQVGLVNARLDTAANHARLERAYLAGFSGFGTTEQLRRASSLAAPLCFIEMALRYRRAAPSVATLHPWMRELVPQTLRLALSRV
jgi:Phosphotransferase enzyme family